MQERPLHPPSGVAMFIALFIATGANIWYLVDSIQAEAIGSIWISVTVAVVLTILWLGFFIVQPNQGAVLQFFGKYVGTCRDHGLRWTNPFYTKKTVTLRIRNFESSKLKVNDIEGSPIEIGAIAVWYVHDTAEAVFNVDDYENFVKVQSEAALRQMATSYPYDLHDDHTISLRSHSKEINEHLMVEIQERLGRAVYVTSEKLPAPLVRIELD